MTLVSPLIWDATAESVEALMLTLSVLPPLPAILNLKPFVPPVAVSVLTLVAEAVRLVPAALLTELARP